MVIEVYSKLRGPGIGQARIHCLLRDQRDWLPITTHDVEDPSEVQALAPDDDRSTRRLRAWDFHGSPSHDRGEGSNGGQYPKLQMKAVLLRQHSHCPKRCTFDRTNQVKRSSQA